MLQYMMLTLAALLLAMDFAVNKVYQRLRGTSPKTSLFFNSVLGLATAIIFFAVNNFKLSFSPYSAITAMLTFDDIGNHWAAKEITFAHENALVEGTSETTFEPDKNVTVQDFTKMLVTLLGYKEMAEQQGGFPHGYMMTGSRLGLFKDLYLEGPDDVTRATVAVMLVNSLDVPLMRMSGFDFSENTAEFIIMDGKNGVELETFRTILEEK